MRIAFQLVTLFAFLYGTAAFYKLKGLAKAAGYPVSVWANFPDPWSSINEMIQKETSKEEKARLITLKMKAQVSMVVAILGFIAFIMSH